MRGRKESHHAPELIVVAGLALALVLPGAGGADPAGRAAALRRQQATLGTRAHAALMSLYSLDSKLVQARGRLDVLRARVAAARAEEQRVARDRTIARLAWRESVGALGAQLRAMYEHASDEDALAVLLGASSIDDAVARLDAMRWSARLNRHTIEQTLGAKRNLALLQSQLVARVRDLQRLEAQAEATTRSLAAARAQRVAYLASLARQRRLNRKQIGRLEASAKSIVQRSQVITARQTTAPISATTTEQPVDTSVRVLVVTATGYSLPGRTATGMPVGWGVVAVDPSVIPLGTRITIPGYGEGVASDTGGAVQGLTIDLWFPTQAQALAWGRRTVTISLH